MISRLARIQGIDENCLKRYLRRGRKEEYSEKVVSEMPVL
jgi:hypothetical protein